MEENNRIHMADIAYIEMHKTTKTGNVISIDDILYKSLPETSRFSSGGSVRIKRRFCYGNTKTLP